jgi:hypothetical protein
VLKVFKVIAPQAKSHSSGELMPTPIESASREYQAFLRIPAGANAFAFGTVEAFRNGVWHQGLLSAVPEPADNSSGAFGIQTGGGFTVEIADESSDEDWFLLDENHELLILEDGSGFLILEY